VPVAACRMNYLPIIIGIIAFILIADWWRERD
jgi:hypothetical protein